MFDLLFLLIIASALLICLPAQAQAGPKQPRYVPITLCQISFKNGRHNQKFISVDAEYVSATPHGLFLTDKHCERKESNYLPGHRP